MSTFVFKLPDLGEGTVEAELLAWHVKPGDEVREDQVIAEVMTEKAAVELPSPVAGRIVSLAGEPGSILRVGTELIVFDVSSKHEITRAAPEPQPAVLEQQLSRVPGAIPAMEAPPQQLTSASTAHHRREAIASEPSRVMASPATRRRAREAGVDLMQVRGSGPGGRITPHDIAAATSRAQSEARPTARREDIEEVKVVGLRRVIAQRMSESKRTIPHFGYVEEVDITELESLRAHLNDTAPSGAAPLSYLPFIVTALCRALERFPQCNALFDSERNVVIRHRAVHVGIATQTSEGLLVPVIRDARSLSIPQLAERIRELSERARARRSPREELTGSTITLSSLGKLGGIVSTPVINAPEMAIVGVNKAIDRAVVDRGTVTIRRMMNLSSAFDHRFVDGYDAAAMIQEIKGLLEHPATLFMR